MANIRAVLLLLMGVFVVILSGSPIQSQDKEKYRFSLPRTQFIDDIISNPKIGLKGAGIIGEQYRWANGHIPYSIHPDIDNEDRLVILTSFAHIEKYTCIRFVPRTTEKDHVLVTYGNFFSDVGKIGGRQTVFLEPNLVDRLGSVAHNFIHTVGFVHEYSRSDRDDFVTIKWSNIIPGFEFNFDKYSADQMEPFDVPYDYGSIMHYPRDTLALDPEVDTVIAPPDVIIGQRRRMSSLDIAKINSMYHCEEKSSAPL